MNSFDRGLMALYSLVVTVLLLLGVLVMAGWQLPLVWLKDLWRDPGQRSGLWAALVVLFLAGLRLIMAAWQKPKAGGRAVVHEGALGQVRISLQAIESLVDKVVGQTQGVREVKSGIIPLAAGVGIEIRVVVTPDVNIPELSRQIQEQVKTYVYQVTGVSVSEIKVLVSNIAAERPRVE